MMRATLSMAMATALAVAACGPDRRQVDADFAAKNAAIEAGVAARAAGPVAAAVPAGPPPGMAPTPMVLTALACEDGSTRTLRYFPEQGIAILMPEGEGKELQAEPVASGVRYAGADIEVRGKGTSYMIEMGDGEPVACSAAG
jgi:hypothetical protein